VGGQESEWGKTGGSELARPALMAGSAAERGIATAVASWLDRYFTGVAILPTFVVMLGGFRDAAGLSFYLSFTGLRAGPRAVQRRLVGWRTIRTC